MIRNVIPCKIREGCCVSRPTKMTFDLYLEYTYTELRDVVPWPPEKAYKYEQGKTKMRQRG